MAANLCPQSQTIRRAGICRLHLGQGLDHDLRGASTTSTPAALRAAREIASARATEHCGCVPFNEYDALPHTGHSPGAATARSTTGFFSLMVFSPK